MTTYRIDTLSLENARKLFESGKINNIETGSVAHTLMEGNGRTTRIWLDMMLKKSLGSVIDWSKVSKDSYPQGIERSPINDLELKVLLKGALTDRVNDRDVISKGIQQSYYYKGYERQDNL